ncbi:hypothetical protein GOP47_0027788 [Adiantum capillus-veneris]|nr:hypothetical protein GOP47_0027788 [Adiantum capillus-veneris]
MQQPRLRTVFPSSKTNSRDALHMLMNAVYSSDPVKAAGSKARWASRQPRCQEFKDAEMLSTSAPDANCG